MDDAAGALIFVADDALINEVSVNNLGFNASVAENDEKIDLENGLTADEAEKIIVCGRSWYAQDSCRESHV